ncbi:MAG: hypothetical protein U1F43_05235 [Myxococcota bacterium]
MVTRLTAEEMNERWRALRSRLLTGLHPEAGDPIQSDVPIAVYESSSVHDPALFARLERARAATGAGALYALGYDLGADGEVLPNDGFRVDGADADAWLAAGNEHGWAINGLSFAIADDSASWVVMSVVDAQVVACLPALLGPLFGDRAAAEAAVQAFAAEFDTPAMMPAFRAMAGYARVRG